MKDNISAILSLVIAVLLLFIFVQNSCTREDTSTNTPVPRTIPIPERFKIPEFTELDFDIITEPKTEKEYVYIPVPQKPDTALLNKYRSENDSLKKELMYADAVTIRSYESKYEDENVEIHLFAETTGTLNKLQLPFYKIKEHDVVVIPDEPDINLPKFNILLGSELGVPTSLDKNFIFKGNIFVQSKDMMYNGSFDTDKRIWAGLAIKL